MTSPQPDAAAASLNGAPKKRRNTWLWISVGLGVIAAGLLIWALTLRSDRDSTAGDLSKAQQELASANQELETAQQDLDDATQAAAQTPTPTPTPTPAPAPEEEGGTGGTAALVAAGALVTGLARELGATQDDVAGAEQEIEDTQKQADDAEQEAAVAKQQADDATDEADKANAEVSQANAERDAAQAKAKVAAECAKAYIAAFGGLFGSGNVREQVPAVRKDLEGITADCRTALAGT